MALFDKKQLNNKQDDITGKINRRRRQILVHSAIYYRYNNNLVSDKTFDDWCMELVSLHNQYPVESSKAVFQDVYKDWTGFSGYDLLKGTALWWSEKKAEQLLRYNGLL